VDALQRDGWDPMDKSSAGSLLIVEDDTRLMECLARAMEVRGFEVTVAGSLYDGLAQIQLNAPDYAVVDMRLGDGSGLDLVAALKQRRPDARAIILTGYGNIATAVRAVKLGAVDYLTKPVDADNIICVLLAPPGGKVDAPPLPMSPDHVRLQHIRQVHEANGHNVSETARRLNMHRRTLQRILSKQAGKREVTGFRV
jgi:two-component system, response regulator RegA